MLHQKRVNHRDKMSTAKINSCVRVPTQNSFSVFLVEVLNSVCSPCEDRDSFLLFSLFPFVQRGSGYVRVSLTVGTGQLCKSHLLKGDTQRKK